MAYQDDGDVIVFSEPILPKKDCAIEIGAATADSWKVKEEVPDQAGKLTKAVKMTVTITDPNVSVEHEEGKPRLTFEQSFNVEQHPYLDKKTGTVKLLNRGLLFSLEEALGFDPVFIDGSGTPLEPFITKKGQKRAPKVEGVRRKLNPEFRAAYFTDDMTPTLNWGSLKVYADIEVEKSEQYGDKNKVARFKPTPVSI